MDLNFKFFITAIVLLSTLKSAALATTISGGRFVEDFSTDDYADHDASTGLWNIVDHVAQSKVFANAAVSGTSRPITFGNGSDGTLDTSNGYTFDTNAYPNGYQFKSVNITGGTISVTGSNALIIRSLTTVNITPSISISGDSGTVGTSGALATSLSTSAGGTAYASRATGGTGGAANPNGQVGSDGLQFDGSSDTGATGGTAGAGAASGGNGGSALGGPGDYDTTGGFVGGGSGAGGGGHANGATHATGGSGGGGGGAIRIAAVGSITVGTITAKGGNGGSGKDEDGAACSGNESGNGAGGNGGAIWIQTFKTFSSIDQSGAGNVNGGSGGTGSGCGVGNAGLAGTVRADGAASGAQAATYTTTAAPASQTYEVLSKAYDLGVLNAKFSTSPSISSVANSGNIAVYFAGSADSKTFSDYTTDLTALSEKNYRYIKMKISVQTAAASGISPQVSQVAFDFSDAGLRSVDLKISPGCGVIQNNTNKPTNSPYGLLASCLCWIALGIIARRIFTAKPKI